jgi:hypothetical protein
MGLPIGKPEGTAFREVTRPFKEGLRELGGQYDVIEPELYKTGLKSPEIVRRLSQAGEKALSNKVPASTAMPIDPELASNPAAAQAALRRLESLERIPTSGSPERTMRTARDIIQGSKREYAASLKPKAPVNLEGGGMKEMSDAMDKAFRGMAPEKAVQALDALDSAYAKMSKLYEIAFKASRSNVGRVPGEFNPRKAVELWKTTKPEELASKFTPDEIAAMDFLMKQSKPGIMAKVLEGVADKGVDLLKRVGLKGLSFHPPVRFTEAVKPSIIKEARQAAYPMGRQVGLEERREEARKKNQYLQAAGAAYQ